MAASNHTSPPRVPGNLPAWAEHAVGAWRVLTLAALLGGAIGYAASYALAPRFKAATLILPPQQQQSSSLAAMASLSALSGLVGGGAVKNSTEQYVTMLQTDTVAERVIEKFKLKEVYGLDKAYQLREQLIRSVAITVGKKDGLIRVEVTDESPQRAADMANDYVEQLKFMLSRLAVTEAQQRRAFFEAQVQTAKDKLSQAQRALEASGFSAASLASEPKSTAESYAKLRAELNVAEVRLRMLSRALAEGSLEIQQQRAVVGALSERLGRVEQGQPPVGKQGSDYISLYREYKYQEALYESFAKQFELARVDEAREGALVQVVDPARPAEVKSFPKRRNFAALGALILLMTTLGSLEWRRRRQASNHGDL